MARVGSSDSSRGRRDRGFTLIEVLVGVFILAVVVTATTPMFILAARENAVGADLGSVGSLAVHRMETLRATDYALLNNGGSLDSDTTGFFDASDPDFVVRWTIADNPNPPAPTKLITVRAVAVRQVIGQPKRVELTVVRGK